MRLNHPLPPLKLLLRKEYLYDGSKHKGKYVPCVLVSVKSIAGKALSFQVLLNNGVLRDKLPISALVTKPCEPISLPMLEMWDNSSNNITVSKYPMLDMCVSVFNRAKQWMPGRYLFTVDFYEASGEFTGWSEEASEHKCKHIIALDSGYLVAQPNNRLKFTEPSFLTGEFPDKPDYHTATEFPSVEGTEKWVGEWFYEQQDLDRTNVVSDAEDVVETGDISELLIDAVIDQDVTRVEEMLNQGANPNVRGGVPLALAVEDKNDDIIDMLVKAGAGWDQAERSIDKTNAKLVSLFVRYRAKYE